MVEYEGSMIQILGAARNLLLDKSKDSSGSLYGIKQVKRGVLPSNTQFPVITMTPEREVVRKVSSSCLYIDKTIRTFIITNSTTKTDIEKLHSYSNNAHQIIRNSYQLINNSNVPLCYASTHTGIDYSELRNSAEFTSTFYTMHTMAPRVTSNTIKENSSLNQISDEVYNYLMQYSNNNLSSFSQILKEDWMLSHERRYPCLVIAALSEQNNEFEAGREESAINFRFDVYSKITSASDNILNKHILLTESVKHLLLSNANWNGTVRDSQYEGTQYGSSMDEEGMTYLSSINMTASGRHTKPFKSTSAS